MFTNKHKGWDWYWWHSSNFCMSQETRQRRGCSRTRGLLYRGGAAAGLESPCMEEGLQQDSGAPVLPCTVSCVFFQKTLRGWLGSTQAKDMIQNTAPGIRGKAVTISQRIGVRLFKGKKIYFTWKLSLTLQFCLMFFHHFLHLISFLVWKSSYESWPGIIILSLQLAVWRVQTTQLINWQWPGLHS